VDPSASYLPRRKATCGRCGHVESVSDRTLRWAPVLEDRPDQPGRFFRCADAPARPVADNASLGSIREGRETAVLLRHGFADWGELYPVEQQRSLRELASACTNDAARLAVAGAAEMAGMCSRWDRFYLKSVETMAGHRFNFTTLTAEPNMWGASLGRGTVRRRIGSMQKAADWLYSCPQPIQAQVVCASSERLVLDDGIADLVLTDPPYHDDVQYSELSAPLRAWAGLPEPESGSAVAGASSDWAGVLARVWGECARVLKPDGHLVFSFANRDPAVWAALFDGLSAAGFQAAGFAVVHSENERDISKRGVRACTMDLLLDCVHADVAVQAFVPESGPTDEEQFLHRAGVFWVQGDWADLPQQLARQSFVRPRS